MKVLTELHIEVQVPNHVLYMEEEAAAIEGRIKDILMDAMDEALENDNELPAGTEYTVSS